MHNEAVFGSIQSARGWRRAIAVLVSYCPNVSFAIKRAMYDLAARLEYFEPFWHGD